MKPTRPIKTFGTWLLETMTVSIFKPDDCFDWGGGEMKAWIETTLGLHDTKGRDPSDPNVYCHSISGWPQANTMVPHTFYFPNVHHAKAFKDRWGGKYTKVPMDQSIRRNEAIFGNYTLRDMMDTLGDPLPYRIKDIILDLKHRGIDYFNNYGHMHQEWSREYLEWPADFVYQSPIGDYDALEDHFRHCWLMTACGFNGFENHLRGIEFRDQHHADLFRIRFGEDPMWGKTDLVALEANWQKYVENLRPICRGW